MFPEGKRSNLVTYMLVTRTLGTEYSVAGLALGPMIVAVNVVLAVILIPKGIGTGLAFTPVGLQG